MPAGATAKPRVAVTGASGAIGSVLCPKLAAAGFEVLALDRNLAPLPQTGWFDKAKPVSALIHLAAASNARAEASATEMAAPHLEFLEGLIAKGFRGHVVFTSSAAVYGGSQDPIPEEAPAAPPNAYGAGKLAVETGYRTLAAAAGLPLTLLRPANIYGTIQDLRRRRVSGLLIEAARRGTPFRLFGDGSSRRDYLHVDDLCDALTEVLRRPPPAGTPRLLNLGSGRGTSLTELVALVETATGQKILRLYEPAQTEAASVVLDSAKVRTELGWSAQVPLEAGLAKLAAELPAA